MLTEAQNLGAFIIKAVLIFFSWWSHYFSCPTLFFSHLGCFSRFLEPNHLTYIWDNTSLITCHSLRDEIQTQVRGLPDPGHRQFPGVNILSQPAQFAGPWTQLLSFYFQALLRLLPRPGIPSPPMKVLFMLKGQVRSSIGLWPWPFQNTWHLASLNQ